MWTICKICGTVVADANLHAATHEKPRPKIKRPTISRPRLEPHHGH